MPSFYGLETLLFAEWVNGWDLAEADVMGFELPFKDISLFVSVCRSLVNPLFMKLWGISGGKTSLICINEYSLEGRA